MALSTVEQVIAKRALETLETTRAGLNEKTLFDFVERSIGRRLTTVERKGVLAKLLEKEWIYDHRNSLTDEILYSISDSGTLAMVAL